MSGLDAVEQRPHQKAECGQLARDFVKSLFGVGMVTVQMRASCPRTAVTRSLVTVVHQREHERGGAGAIGGGLYREGRRPGGLGPLPSRGLAVQLEHLRPRNVREQRSQQNEERLRGEGEQRQVLDIALGEALSEPG